MARMRHTLQALQARAQAAIALADGGPASLVQNLTGLLPPLANSGELLKVFLMQRYILVPFCTVVEPSAWSLDIHPVRSAPPWAFTLLLKDYLYVLAFRLPGVVMHILICFCHYVKQSKRALVPRLQKSCLAFVAVQTCLAL